MYKNIKYSQITQATEAARQEWEGWTVPEYPLIGLRFPPRALSVVEMFVLVNDPKEGDGLLYFAGTNPEQIYVVALSKCEEINIEKRNVRFIQITDTDDDKSIDKSPLRAVGCTIALGNTMMNERRIYAAGYVAKAAFSAFSNV